MEDDKSLKELSNEELQSKIKSLMNNPVVDRMRNEAGYLPVWAMAGGGLAWFFSDWTIKTGKSTPSSPRLAKIGFTLLGAFGGFQLGLWKLRSLYHELDPDMKVVGEGRRIFTEIRARQMQPSNQQNQQACPIQNRTLSSPIDSPSQKTNKYGDVIQEDSSIDIRK